MAKRTVKQGESGLKIAQELGISYSSLLAANPGVSSIRPGVTLRIPNKAPSAYSFQGEYGPKGYTGPKDTTSPGFPVVKKPTRRPPVSAGRFAPPPVQPPVQRPPDMQPTDPTRIAPKYVPPDMRPTDPTRIAPRAVSPDMQGDVTRQPQQITTVNQFLKSTPKELTGIGLGDEYRAQAWMRRLFATPQQPYLPSRKPGGEPPSKWQQFLKSTPTDWWEDLKRANVGAKAEGRGLFVGGATGQRARQAAGVPGTGISTGFGDFGVVPPDSWESSLNQVADAQLQGEQGVVARAAARAFPQIREAYV